MGYGVGLLGLVAVVAAYVAGTLGADILFLVSWAFSIAAAGLFAGLVLGIWWKRAGDAAGIWGIIAGFGSLGYRLAIEAAVALVEQKRV